MTAFWTFAHAHPLTALAMECVAVVGLIALYGVVSETRRLRREGRGNG